MNLHDWIDELCDVLDVETEVDEGLLKDLNACAAEQVEPAAGPVTAFLLGYAAAADGGSPDTVEDLAARAQTLAEGWDRPRDAPDPVDVEVTVPDDSGVDHSDETFDE